MTQGFRQAIDDDTVRAAAGGDMAACERLYRSYSAPVFTLARRMLGEASAAEDALQDSFLQAFGKLSEWRGEAPFGMWLRRIVVNRCLMHLRNHWESRREPLDSVDETGARERTDEGHDLGRLLDRLDTEDRMVMWLKEVEGYSHAEIAELCGQSVSYSKSRLARAHERLRTLLAEEVRQCTQQRAS
ncbi:RNA polymerase sigma factor [Natronospira bacteriovora]|uniref:Sigma-70 family RNA polymerase sigma factor n=1 Tax=Natronospira bacteriovora TaxID=3069753 RepID=A0ABU0W834_9GAMM|nr:sigma-70 family RNA polymerase sigma factor [Natronospira sp. AB-CW4]MDQ2070079.1 sigma-70 family RNA polymerase sigma factor [Natronospira sp. AB-CW4]